MKRAATCLIALSILLMSIPYVYGGEYKKFDIKYGMHEKIVNEEYGEPVLSKNIKVHPIPRKKALYELDENNYMILYYFSGRMHKIVLLEDMGLDEASSIFNEEE